MVYLWHEEGLTDRNRAILYAAGGLIVKHSGQWLIGGDFNNTPQDLRYIMAKWLKAIGGEVCAPGNITCKSVHGGRTIDFFIIDSRISHGVEGIWTQMDFPSSPHYMVVLRLDVTAVRVQVVKIAVPRAFEPRPAIGCTRAPESEPDMLPEISKLQEATVNEVFKNVMQNSERHLCRAFDCVLPCGAPDPR